MGTTIKFKVICRMHDAEVEPEVEEGETELLYTTLLFGNSNEGWQIDTSNWYCTADIYDVEDGFIPEAICHHTWSVELY